MTVWGWLPKSFAPLMRAAAVHLAAQTVEVPSKEREVVLYRPILQWGPPLDEGLCVRWTGLHFFFSFELSYLKAAKKANLAGAPEIGYKNLLRSALSLCRMVLRGLERPAAPPH